MAVSRMKFPDRAAIESAARAAESWTDPDGVETMSRAAREIRRAADRPGRSAELTAEEAIHLASVADVAAPRIRGLLREKGVEAEAALEWDRRELARRRAIGHRLRQKFGAA